LLLCDLRGFTELSNRLPAERVDERMPVSLSTTASSAMATSDRASASTSRSSARTSISSAAFQGVCGETGRAILTSQQFARLLGEGDVQPIGRFALKGFRDPVELFSALR
jgi:class 3 adenylate cyclase